MSIGSVARYLDDVQALAPRIEAAADEIERERRLPLALAKAMARGGLFRLWRPRVLGGEEADAAAVVRVVEAVSRIDGAAGWCLAIGSNSSLVSGYLPKQAAREIYGSDPDMISAGAWPPYGEATVVEGGYRATGRWPFASGCQHAQWIQGGCRIVEGGQPRLQPDGTPAMRVLFFPAAACEILDTWHTGGLRGTGSHDFTVSDVFVPTDHAVSFREPPAEAGPLYALPTIGLSAAAIAAVALGIARHAIDILCEVAQVKVATRSQQALGRSAMVQADLGRAEGRLRSGRAFLLETLDEVWRTAAAGEALSIPQRALMWLAATQAAEAAIAAVDLVYGAGGSASVYVNGRIERCLRDVRTVGQHIAVARGNYEMIGQALLGFDMRGTVLLRADDRSAALVQGAAG